MKKLLTTVASAVLVLGGIGVRALLKYERDHENSETTIECSGVKITFPGDWRLDNDSSKHSCSYYTKSGRAMTLTHFDLPVVYECGSLETLERTMEVMKAGHKIGFYVMVSPTDVTFIVVEAERMDRGPFGQFCARMFETARNAHSSSALPAPSEGKADGS